MKRSGLIVLFGLFMCLSSLAQLNSQDGRLQVALRYIGHQILWEHGDSISPLPAVESNFQGQYIIRFPSEITFEAEGLIEIFDRSLHEKGFSNAYRCEMRKCEGDSIIYSFEIGEGNSQDIIPCIGRIQNLDCYYLQVQLLDLPSSESKSSTSSVASKSKHIYWLLAFGIFALLFFYFRPKRSSPDEFIAANNSQNDDFIFLGDTRFSYEKLQLINKEGHCELSAKEADLLAFLSNNLNKRVEKEKIFAQVWPESTDYIGRTLDVFISKLRKKLAADPKIRIVNIRGFGYQLIIDQSN